MPDLNLAAVGQEKWLITDTTTQVCVYEGEIIKTHKHTHIHTYLYRKQMMKYELVRQARPITDVD